MGVCGGGVWGAPSLPGPCSNVCGVPPLRSFFPRRPEVAAPRGRGAERGGGVAVSGAAAHFGGFWNCHICRIIRPSIAFFSRQKGGIAPNLSRTKKQRCEHAGACLERRRACSAASRSERARSQLGWHRWRPARHTWSQHHFHEKAVVCHLWPKGHSSTIATLASSCRAIAGLVPGVPSRSAASSRLRACSCSLGLQRQTLGLCGPEGQC